MKKIGCILIALSAYLVGWLVGAVVGQFEGIIATISIIGGAIIYKLSC